MRLTKLTFEQLTATMRTCQAQIAYTQLTSAGMLKRRLQSTFKMTSDFSLPIVGGSSCNINNRLQLVTVTKANNRNRFSSNSKEYGT